MKKTHITFLSFISTFAVVLLHSTNHYFSGFGNTPQWITALVLQALSYWAVAVFVMLSGAKIIGYHTRYSTTEYFKRRSKVVIAYLLWTLIFLVRAVYLKRFELTPRATINVFTYGSSNVVGIFWFFFPLFEVYLLLPIFTHLCTRKNKRVIEYLIVYIITSAIIIPTVTKLTGINFKLPQLGSSYILLPILGWYIESFSFSKTQRRFIYLLGIAGFAFKIVVTYVLSIRSNELNTAVQGYMTLNNIVMAIAVYVWFKYLDYTKVNKKILNTISWLDRYSFGVFLVQMPVLFDVFYRFFDQGSIRVMLLEPIPIYLICVMICFIIRNIPKIGKILIP